jgi:hypothetical protein
MISRNCEWVEEADKEPPRGPRKRLRTEAQAAASRANGSKSKGATSDTGREKVKFNAVRHGAACKEIVFLEGEDEGAFWARVDRVVAEQGVEGELEIEAIKSALYSRVTKERAINAQAMAVTEARTKIEENYHHQKLAEVTGLIGKLAGAPKLTVKKLMDSTAGCVFLTRELRGILNALHSAHSLCRIHRSYCLLLTGHHPGDLFTDPVVRQVNRAYMASFQCELGEITIELAAQAFEVDRPAEMPKAQFSAFMTPLVADLPTADQGRRRLERFLQSHIKRLEERKELVRYREERELSAAVGVAQSPCDRESVTRDRYITQSDRTFNTQVRVLLALKQERRQYGDESRADRGDYTESRATPTDQGHRGPDAASRPEEMAPQAVAIPVVNEEKVNEPGATQVVVPVTGNDADRCVPTNAIGPAPLLSPEDHAAIQAHYQKSQEYVRRKLAERSGINPPGPPDNS